MIENMTKTDSNSMIKCINYVLACTILTAFFKKLVMKVVYCPDINPIALAWASFEQYVASKNYL